jgi:hypothetical protein
MSPSVHPLTPPRRARRRALAAALLAMSLACVAAISVPAPAAAAPAAGGCAGGKVAWRVEGRTQCLPTALRTARGPADAANLLGGIWIADVARGIGLRRRVLPRLTAPRVRALRGRVNALARAARTAVGRRTAAHAAAAPQARSAGGAVLAQRVEGGTQTLDGGVTVTSSATGTLYEDQSVDVRMQLDVADRGGNRLRVTPLVGDLVHAVPAVGCPTARGIVRAEEHQLTGGTTIAFKRDRVIASATEKVRIDVTAEGHVGRDARLHDVTTRFRLQLAQYQRGVQVEQTVTATAAADREGGVRSTGGTADVRLRVAGWSARRERAEERKHAAEVQGDEMVRETVATYTSLLRDRLLDAERTWYELPNDCAEIALDPAAGVRLGQGERRAVSGSVRALAGGGEASGSIRVAAASRGDFAATRAEAEPGAPARFEATGAAPQGSARTTVAAALVATSTAGRAQADWTARGEAPTVPAAFDATVSLDEQLPGIRVTFAGSGRYERTALSTLPDGTVYAWYALTSATLAEARRQIGDTCGWLGSGAGAGELDGDLELHVPRGGGAPAYALRYDLTLSGVEYAGRCAGFDPFTDALSVHLDSGRPGPVAQRLRPGTADFHFAETGVTDVTVVDGASGTAAWELRPDGAG